MKNRTAPCLESGGLARASRFKSLVSFVGATVRTTTVALLTSLLTLGQALAAPNEDLIVRELRKVLSSAPQGHASSAIISGHRIVVAEVGTEEIVSELGSPQLVVAEQLTSGDFRVRGFFRTGVGDEYTYKFDRDSLVLRLSTAHHGWHSRSYRIRPMGNKLMIVGVAQQSLVLAGDGLKELWSGSSADFATSRAKVWAKLVDLKHSGNGQVKSHVSYAEFESGVPPHGSTSHAFRVKNARARHLNQLHDASEEELFLCNYVDENLKFRKARLPGCLK